MKKNILIILNAIVYNKGSEALVRGLTKMCKKYEKDSCITLVSSEEEFSSKLNIENVDKYQKKYNYNRKSLMRLIVAVLKRIKVPINIINYIKYSKLMNLSKEQDFIFIIGADNYDITYGIQNDLNVLHTYLRKNTNAKMILYDCSIGERDITDTLIKDLENFDYITVRESITEKNIEKYISKEKLYYFPDPAFIMEREQVELPINWKHGKMVGINVSNLITNKEYGSKPEKIIEAYDNLLNYILTDTNFNIVLVPHVMNNADLQNLKVLYEKHKNNDRVILIENQNLNAKQLKYIISNCALYVGARTHSTIAAYSTLVPTLVLGYSVKSKGIAKDIFGTSEKYVLPVSNLENSDYLVNGFKWLLENQQNIKTNLESVMPGYLKKVENTINLLEK